MTDRRKAAKKAAETPPARTASVVLVLLNELAHRGNHGVAFGAAHVEHRTIRCSFVADNKQSETETIGHRFPDRAANLFQLFFHRWVANFKCHLSPLRHHLVRL